MRHEKLTASEGIDAKAIASVWPSTAQLAPLPLPELVADEKSSSPHETGSVRSAEAVPDVPASVGVLIVAVYAALLMALATATAVPGKSGFAIAISAFFLFMFFAVPAAMLRVRVGSGRRATWDAFMEMGIDTYTGRCSGGAALIQMLVVPVALTLGVIGMAIAIALIF